MMVCQPTITEIERIARLKRAVESNEREKMHEVVCCFCGKRWLVNQFHPAGIKFSCGDAVQYSDYEEACK